MDCAAREEARREDGGWHRATALVLAAYLVLAYAYVWTVQPGYGPDEPRHFHYVRLLAEQRRLPRLVNGVEHEGAHTLHPPLYYALAAPVYLAARGLGERGAIRVLKHFSPLLLLGALLLYLSLLRRLFPGRPFAVAAALAVVALLPEFQLEAAVLNNDAPAILLSAWLLWLLVRAHPSGPCLRTALLAGLAMALFVNTKATGWTLAPLFALGVLLRAVRPGAPRAPALWLRDLAAAYGVLLLLGTWWYVRNYQLYGQPVPLDFMGDRLRPFDLLTRRPLLPLEVYTSGAVVVYGERAAVGLFQSFWGQIDWFREAYRPAIYGTLLLACALAAGGWALAGMEGLRKRSAALGPALLPAAALLLNAGHTWYVATFLHLGFYQGGRYLMPSVFGAGTLLAAGWERLLPPRARPAALVLVVTGLLLLNALCLVELVTVLNPRYVRP